MKPKLLQQNYKTCKMYNISHWYTFPIIYSKLIFQTKNKYKSNKIQTVREWTETSLFFSLIFFIRTRSGYRGAWIPEKKPDQHRLFGVPCVYIPVANDALLCRNMMRRRPRILTKNWFIIHFPSFPSKTREETKRSNTGIVGEGFSLRWILACKFQSLYSVEHIVDAI
jgi:hypothetical protein